jgi:WhiB family redox-sensing transcriptional regulator
MAPDEPDPWAYLEQLTRRSTWQARAACRGSGTAAFFPSPGATLETARALCVRCSVREPCLAYAMADVDLQGVWGGTSARERRRIRRETAA